MFYGDYVLISKGSFMQTRHLCVLVHIWAGGRPGAKYFEKYSNTLQLLCLINDYNYITITGPVEM